MLMRDRPGVYFYQLSGMPHQLHTDLMRTTNTA